MIYYDSHAYLIFYFTITHMPIYHKTMEKQLFLKIQNRDI